MILVTLVMALLGKRAWWMPRWMEHIVPQLRLEGSAAAATAAAAGAADSGADAARPGPRPAQRGS
jgi:RND superfamily putative drug exporter